MRGTIFFFSFAILLCLQNVRALQTDYMTGSKSSIELKMPQAGYYSSGILKACGAFSYPSNMNKTFNVSAPYGYSLLVSIRVIDLRPSNQDALTIFDLNGPGKLSFTNSYIIKDRTYYRKEDKTFYSSNGKIGIRFTTGASYDTFGYDGFELVYTVQGSGFHCYSDDFLCNNGRCIAHELRCDDHNHCGDQSSLRNCGGIIIHGKGNKVGVAIGIVFLVIALACGCFIACRKIRSSGEDSQTTIITSHPPPSNLSAYPPAYPQPGTYYPPPPPPYSQGIVNPSYH